MLRGYWQRNGRCRDLLAIGIGHPHIFQRSIDLSVKARRLRLDLPQPRLEVGELLQLLLFDRNRLLRRDQLIPAHLRVLLKLCFLC